MRISSFCLVLLAIGILLAGVFVLFGAPASQADTRKPTTEEVVSAAGAVLTPSIGKLSVEPK